MSDPSTPKRALHPGWIIGGFFGLLVVAQLAFYVVAFSLPSDALHLDKAAESAR